VPVVIVGLAEDKRLELDGIIQLQGRLTLTQLAYLIACSAGFMGVLSGPAHIAGMLGIPTVTLFGGHSHVVEWAPVGDGLNLIHPTPCAPCYRQSCPGWGVACLTQLEPKDFFSSIESFFRDRWEEIRLWRKEPKQS
jgi:heptosyltransferase-1